MFRLLLLTAFSFVLSTAGTFAQDSDRAALSWSASMDEASHSALTPYDIRVYPVPVQSVLNVDFQAPASGQLSVSCFDVLGRSVQPALEIDLIDGGLHTEQMPLDSLTPGTYVLRFVYRSSATDRPLIVHRRINVE